MRMTGILVGLAKNGCTFLGSSRCMAVCTAVRAIDLASITSTWLAMRLGQVTRSEGACSGICNVEKYERCVEA